VRHPEGGANAAPRPRGLGHDLGTRGGTKEGLERTTMRGRGSERSKNPGQQEKEADGGAPGGNRKGLLARD